jgi:hypothetical protein
MAASIALGVPSESAAPAMRCSLNSIILHLPAFAKHLHREGAAAAESLDPAGFPR